MPKQITEVTFIKYIKIKEKVFHLCRLFEKMAIVLSWPIRTDSILFLRFSSFRINCILYEPY